LREKAARELLVLDEKHSIAKSGLLASVVFAVAHVGRVGIHCHPLPGTACRDFVSNDPQAYVIKAGGMTNPPSHTERTRTVPFGGDHEAPIAPVSRGRWKCTRQ
jgi:hypothetical protein